MHNLRWHCIRSHQCCCVKYYTTTLYFGNPLSLNKVCCCINKCNLNLCHSRRKQYVNSMQCAMGSLGQSYSQIVKNRVHGNVCCGPCFSLFLGKMDIKFSVPKAKGTIQIFTRDRCKSKHLSWYGVHQCKQHGWEYEQIDMGAYIGGIDLLSIWSLVSSEIRQGFCLQNFTNYYPQFQRVKGLQLKGHQPERLACMTASESKKKVFLTF